MSFPWMQAVDRIISAMMAMTPTTKVIPIAMDNVFNRFVTPASTHS